MNVFTTRFGVIVVDDSAIIETPEGLYGFEEVRKFCLVGNRPSSPFKWLQSLDDSSLAFVVADPFLFFPDYEVFLSDEDTESLALRSPEQAVVLAIVTVPSKPWRVTANLVAPLVLNVETRQARQVVLTDPRYTTRHRLLPERTFSMMEDEVAYAC